MTKDISLDVLSDIIVHMKYARYILSKKRRETWDEIVDRNKKMHIKKFPKLKKEIEHNYNFVYNKKVLPSSRSLQFAGKPIELNNVRLFNCSFCPIDSPEVFKEAAFCLMSGTGYGYSVQLHHIEKLPEIYRPLKRRRYLIPDSIEGWAESIGLLMDSYLGTRKSLPVFDYNDIRERGTPLKTSGGQAPGPEPLKECHFNIQKILDRKKDGEKLTALECHDILCHIASCVVVAGTRRSSMIVLFSFDDEEMKSCKTGDWRKLNPQRDMANNSAAILRHKITQEKFFEYFDYMHRTNEGEPGIWMTNDSIVYGTNPCGEAGLKKGSFCNITIINMSTVINQEDFNERAKVASFIGSLQASYTDFHFLRDFWKDQTDEDALLGVTLTGLADERIMKLNFKEAAKIVTEENERVSSLIGTRKAARATFIAPGGTSSLVLKCSSGVHSYWSEYYIRRVTVTKDEPIYSYLIKELPDLVEDDYFKPSVQAKISIPIKAPDNAITRHHESALQFLARVSKIYVNWVKPGHRDGSNHHNVSCTVYIKDSETDRIKRWLWENKEKYTAITIFPFDDNKYTQAPLEEISEQNYKKLVTHLKRIDLTKVKEQVDNTKFQQDAACAGNSCEII